MRILVTGALGTLGCPLVWDLTQRGHKVTGCDLRHSAQTREFFCLRADVSSHRQLKDVFQISEPNLVVHLAAEFGRLNGRDFPEQTWKTNALGTRNVLNLAYEYGSKTILASSSEIYGELPNDGEPIHETVAESTALRPGNDYAITKLVNELQARNEMHRQEIMVLRFFNAYGPGEHYHPYRSVVALFCYQLLRGLPITVYRDYHRVFMYIDDFIPTLATACERFKPGAFVNIGGAEYRSVEDLAELVRTEVGASRDLIEFREQDEHNVVNKRPNIETSRVLFGHNPTVTLEEGVPKTLDWMRDVYEVRQAVTQ